MPILQSEIQKIEVMIIRDFKPYKTYKRLIGIGEHFSTKNVYKYMSVDTAIKVLQSNTIRFSNPTSWPDPYEKRFIQADYRKVDKQNVANKNIVACCLTRKPTSEAAWRIYASAGRDEKDGSYRHCVQFCISVGQFRQFIDVFAEQNKLGLYEGTIDYNLKDEDINSIHHKSSPYYSELFDNFSNLSFLNLLLIKRKAFDYEEEVRYILQGNPLYSFGKDIDIHIPWSLVLNKIVLDTTCTKDEIQYVNKALSNNKELCRKEYPERLATYVDVKQNTIYKERKPIIIGID